MSAIRPLLIAYIEYIPITILCQIFIWSAIRIFFAVATRRYYDFYFSFNYNFQQSVTVWATHAKRPFGVEYCVLKYNFCTVWTIAHPQLILAHTFIFLRLSFPSPTYCVHPAGKREPSNKMADPTIIASGHDKRCL